MVLIFVCSLSIGSAFGCACAPLGTPQEELVKSDAVFLGKVTKVDTFQDQVSGATFDVKKSWKGVPSDSVRVTTLPATDCNYEFQLNESYVVYAYGNESLSVNSCTRTSLLAYASEDITALGPGIDHTILDEFTNKVNISNGYGDVKKILVSGNDVFVVWNGGQGISFKKSSDGGTTFGNEIRLADTKYAFELDLAVSKNNVYVVWVDADYDNYKNRDIFVAKSSDGGNTFSKPINISKNTLGSQAISFSEPRIATFGNNIYAVWIIGNYNWHQLYFARSTNGGNSFDEPKNISNGGYPSIPSLSAYQDNVFVVWTDNSKGNIPPSRVVFAKSTDKGHSFGEKITLSEEASTPNPSLVTVKNNLYLTWLDQSGISFRKSMDGGNTFEPARILNPPGHWGYPKIAVSDDNVYVTWMERPLWDVFFVASNDGGNSFSDVAMLTNNTIDRGPYASFEPQITAAKNTVMISWEMDNPTGRDIFSQVSTDYGKNFGVPIEVDKMDGVSQKPLVAASERDAFVVWLSDFEGGQILLSKYENPIKFSETDEPENIPVDAESPLSLYSNYLIIGIAIATTVGTVIGLKMRKSKIL